VNTRVAGQIQLAGQQSAAAAMYEILVECISVFPEPFRHLSLPTDPNQFRRGYAEMLPLFEASRLASNQRAAIAEHLAESFQRRLVWQGDHSTPIAEALAEPGTPMELKSREPASPAGWLPSLHYRDGIWEGKAIGDLGAELVARNVITPPAGQALRWAGEHSLDDGKLTLTRRKIVMMGASAEMAPTQQWLEAGATVLWLDVVPPPQKWQDTYQFAGRLLWPAETIDLLQTDPARILSTIVAFADGDALDLGLYAYAPGQAREVRLTAAMNAIVAALPSALRGSITMLVSPTTPAELSEYDLDVMSTRQNTRSAWEACLSRLRLLGNVGGSARIANAAATRTVVGIQGASYQAAQYLGKIVTAESWASQSFPASNTARATRISANTAAITQTRSLQHPVFDAAFVGASAFGVETFTPELSRQVNGLLAVHDWLHPEPSVPGQVRVHGGIHTMPYPLQATLRVAAVLGFARSPSLLRGLLR
jgi:hypothetical protein